MATFTNNLPDLVTDGLRQVTFNRLSRFPEQFSTYYNINSSSKNDETDTYIGTFGLVAERFEGDPVSYDDPPQGFDVTYTHREFAKGFRVGRILMEDDQYSIINKMPTGLASSLKETIETDGANVLNNGFAGGFVGGDGVQLFSTAHPLPGGGTQSNRPAVNSDLSQTSLEQADIDIAEWLDDRGKKVNLTPVSLIIPKQLDWTARRILGSDKDPDTANNTMNPAFNWIRPNMVNYLTDPDAWFIQCDMHDVNWFWRRLPDFDRDNDFDTDNLKFKLTARWSNGFSDWYGMYGSPGA